MEPIPRDVTGNRSNWPTGWIIPPLTVSPALARISGFTHRSGIYRRMSLKFWQKMQTAPVTKPAGIEVSAGESTLVAKACTASSIFFAKPGTSCPAHYAAFTADDDDYAFLACCPLPGTDILGSEPAVQRQGQCGPDEVATGVVSGRMLLCTHLNSKRYKLGPVTPTCYNGSGSSGGNGSQKCGAPPATLQAMVTQFGSDACIGFPFGQLIVRNSGKNCTDISSARLLKLDGTPVEMLPSTP